MNLRRIVQAGLGALLGETPAKPTKKRKRRRFDSGAVGGPSRLQLAEREARRRSIPDAFQSMPGIEEWMQNGR